MRISQLGFALLLVAATTATAGAQNVTIKEEKPGLLKAAKVSQADAIKAAQTAVPKGTIQSAEIEREHGKLIYSFDIKVPGKTGIDEINVDAVTGKVLAHEHESPAKEKAEERGEKHKSKH